MTLELASGPSGLVDAIGVDVVGRRDEISRLVAGLAAGRDVLLEGPPGVSKSTLLRATAAAVGTRLLAVEGSPLLTPARLVGVHDPSRVVAHGYRDPDFVAGPLVEAMRSGAHLYVEEFNRVPDDTLNVLLGPLAERRLVVPRYGVVEAAPGFRLIAAMNPHHDAGAGRISRSVADRLLRIAFGYQSASEERTIVARRAPGADERLVALSTAVVRATREHPLVVRGSSVRGAIDMARVTPGLARLHGVEDPFADAAGWDALVEAAQVTLSGRIAVDPSCGATAEELLTEIVLAQLAPPSADAASFTRARARRPGGRRRAAPSISAALRPDEAPDRELVWRRPGQAGEDVVHDGAAAAAAAQKAAATPAGARDGLAGPAPADAPAGPDSAGATGADGDADRDATPQRADEVDAQRLDEARRIARLIAVRTARRVPSATLGAGRLRPTRFAYRSDDLDVDRTVEEIAAKPYPEARDFWVSDRVRARRAYALLLDVSGSMRGEHLTVAAMATAAMLTVVGRDETAVVAFWRDAAVLKRLSDPLRLEPLLADVLSLRGMGLTNLHLGLRLGLDQLQGARTADHVAVLLSDGGHNVGPDPLAVARRYDTLHVVCTSDDPVRVQACRELAEAGRGRCAVAADADRIVDAVAYCLGA